MSKYSAGLTGLLGLGIGIVAPFLLPSNSGSFSASLQEAQKLYNSFQTPQAIKTVQTIPTTIDTYTCAPAQYTVRIVSYAPLIMHLENFFTPFERTHLLALAEDTYTTSNVVLANGSIVPSIDRTSTSATLPRDDKVISCIYERVSEFQGYTPSSAVETLQIAHYVQGQEYKPHYDWAYLNNNRTSDRITTFFGILQAECHDCGTHFPRLLADWSSQDQRWCNFVECNDEALTVKPIEGSALFWRNLLEDGQGDMDTLHSGRLLTNGVKAGLNIWTREEVDDRLREVPMEMPEVRVGTGAPPVMHYQEENV